jgi:hypothetical protein
MILQTKPPITTQHPLQHPFQNQFFRGPRVRSDWWEMEGVKASLPQTLVREIESGLSSVESTCTALASHFSHNHVCFQVCKQLFVQWAMVFFSSHLFFSPLGWCSLGDFFWSLRFFLGMLIADFLIYGIHCWDLSCSLISYIFSSFCSKMPCAFQCARERRSLLFSEVPSFKSIYTGVFSCGPVIAAVDRTRFDKLCQRPTNSPWL